MAKEIKCPECSYPISGIICPNCKKTFNIDKIKIGDKKIKKKIIN